MGLRHLRTAIALLFLTVPLSAHELGMVQVEGTFRRDGTYVLDLVIDPEHAVSPQPLAAATRVSFDGKPVVLPRPELEPQRIRFRGRTPSGVSKFTFDNDAITGYFVLKLRNEGESGETTQWVKGGKESAPFRLDKAVVPQSRWKILGLYLFLGFTHIVPRGLDHVLFVLGIFLLYVRLRPVLWQVTAFTVAHTVTLALTIYGIVSLPASIVEPLIALSIVYVAVENVFTSTLHAWRPLIVFCFGLLHGMGFAGVLTEIGLPRSEFLPALLAFNAGVELGQLTVILTAFVLLGLPFRKQPWYRTRVVVPGSLLIAAAGLFWFVQRVQVTARIRWPG